MIIIVNPANSTLVGPTPIPVAGYTALCGGGGASFAAATTIVLAGNQNVDIALVGA